MRYVALIYGDENKLPPEGSPEFHSLLEEHSAFGRKFGSTGNIQGGQALQPTTTATTVRVRNDETLITDGPFAETKENLGGFYMIDAGDLDEAIAIAAEIPGARTGSVEVRPVAGFDS